jgi:general secretion pathway protein A
VHHAPTSARSLTPVFAEAVRNELAVRSETKNALQAFNALAVLWQAPPIRKLNDRTPLEQELKRQAGQRHLEITPFTGDLDTLLRLDAPALLVLSPRETKGTFIVALSGIRDGELLVQPPLLGRSAFSRAEIASLWSGRAHIVWQNRKNIRSPLTQGERGPSVKKVQNLLQTAGFSTLKANGIYDEATVKAVKEFQKSRNLKQTGTASPLTLIHLYKAGHDRSIPSLAEKGEGGGK